MAYPARTWQKEKWKNEKQPSRKKANRLGSCYVKRSSQKTWRTGNELAVENAGATRREGWYRACSCLCNVISGRFLFRQLAHTIVAVCFIMCVALHGYLGEEATFSVSSRGSLVFLNIVAPGDIRLTALKRCLPDLKRLSPNDEYCLDRLSDFCPLHAVSRETPNVLYVRCRS